MAPSTHHSLHPSKRVSFGTIETREYPLVFSSSWELVLGWEFQDTGCSKVRDSGTRQVHFGTVEIREYDIVLSDNPACEFGPSIELGWDYFKTKQLAINEFEPTRRLRTPEEFYLYLKERVQRLQQVDCSMEEIHRVSQDKNRLHKQRQEGSRIRNPVLIIERQGDGEK